MGRAFPPRPPGLPRARLRAGFLKGPRAGGGASRGAEPGRVWASGRSGLGRAQDGGGCGAGPGGTRREVRAGDASLAALSPRAELRTPREAAQGPQSHRAGLGPHVRGGGGVPHKGPAEGALPDPPGGGRAFPGAKGKRAGRGHRRGRSAAPLSPRGLAGPRRGTGSRRSPDSPAGPGRALQPAGRCRAPGPPPMLALLWTESSSPGAVGLGSGRCEAMGEGAGRLSASAASP